MYTTIRVVVEAHDKSEALDAAELFFTEHLIHTEGGPFDHYSLVNEDSDADSDADSDSDSDSDSDAVAVPLDSERGRAEVTDAWNRTRDRMAHNIEPAVECIQVLCNSHPDDSTTDDIVQSFLEVLLNQNGEDLIRHQLAQACAHDSTDYLLYKQQWSTHGISTYAGWEHIQECMSESNDDTAVDTDIDTAGWWVVPLSVHY
jgi:hypothetical protein